LNAPGHAADAGLHALTNHHPQADPDYAAIGRSENGGANVSASVRQEESADQVLSRQFIENHNLVHAVAFRILRDHDEAEDVVQLVFLKALRAKREMSGLGSRYFGRAAKHEAISVLRRRAHETALSPRLSSDIVSPEAGPDEQAARTEAQQLLAARLDRLPTRCGQVVFLVVLEDLKHPEIAVRLHIGVKAVEKQVQRARRLLFSAGT
jgi:RNA polymerase sigma-70 factor (ECF subfamily)